MKSFFKVVQDRFEEKLTEEMGDKKTGVIVNYASADLGTHYEIDTLIKKYEEHHSTSFDREAGIYLVINNSNEKFVLKQFKSTEAVETFFSNLDNNETFEDVSLSVFLT